MVDKLLERDKNDVAALLKASCFDKSSHILSEFMDHLLGNKSKLSQREIVDWCKTLIAGDKSYTSFCDQVRSFNNSSVCGLVWNADYVAYRCRTCAKTPCMSLCSECFLAADHNGHDFNMFKSQAGGACDCGDESVMNPKGFCLKHLIKHAEYEQPPNDLLVIAEVVIPKLFVELLYLLGHQTIDKSDATILVEVDCLVEFLQELSNMGTIMQNVMCRNICDEFLYSSNFKNPLTDYFYEKRYLLAHASLVCDYKNDIDFPELTQLDKPLTHNSIIDELFFWIIRYQFFQSLVTLVLSLLPNEHYKMNFVKVFMKHYISSMNSICFATDKSVVSNAIVHISVQLLSPMHLAIETVKNHHLLEIILICLKHIIRPSLMKLGKNLVVNCSQGSNLKEHCYWPVVTDIVNVLSHAPVINYFLSNCFLISAWARIISYFQGMNLNKKEKHRHLEFEPEGYYQAFSAELEICSTPLWTMLMHLNNQNFDDLSKKAVNIFMVVLSEWLDAVEEVKSDVMSFHFPLHRYLSLLISNAMINQELNSNDLIPSNDFLRKLLIHPLHLLACYSEINCNVWVRNGQQIKGQAMFYTHWNFASSMMDPDFFLVQLVASRLDPDEVLKLILSEYHVMDILSFEPNKCGSSRHFQPEHELPMLESCLYFLASLLNIRVLSGDVSDLIPNEIISLLCVSDRTHSQLSSSIPDRCESHNPDWINAIEATLPKVSYFKPPVFEIGTTPQQGKYLPQEHIWLEKYNPLHVRMRTLYKKDYQASFDRFSDFVKQQNLYKGSSTLWPPFRLPEPIHPSLEGLYRILHCSTMHALIFSLLYKVINVKSLPDSIIYLTIHLIELVITLPCEARNRKLCQCTEFRDGMFGSWFSSNNFFENILMFMPNIIIRTKDGDENNSFNSKMEGEEISEVDTDKIPINESIITLLIKLYSKFSKEPYFYDGSTKKECCVGDGKFFIKNILDKICAQSEICARDIMKLCCMEDGSVGVYEGAIQDRRLKAKLRQQRLLNDFASKQKKFMRTQIDLLDKEYKHEGEVYDCCICNMSTPSTPCRPICVSARICPTSILGQQKSENLNFKLYNIQMEQFNKYLENNFHKTNKMLWYKASYLQTCGHFMHLDCYVSYINSLQHSQNQTVFITKGEFFCPMCRQISNTILPLIENDFVSHCNFEVDEQIEKLLETNRNELNDNKELSEAINKVMDDLERNPPFEYENKFSFFAAILRNNLEINLLKIHSKRKFSVNSAVRKSCIYSLYVVLSIASKKFIPNYFTSLWKHISVRTITRNFENLGDIPLLLEDISDVFIQFLLALPFNLEEKQFFILVRNFYNVKLIQLLVHMVCDSASLHVSPDNELSEVIKMAIDEKDDSLKLDMEILSTECLLPYLRIASLVHHHIYNSSDDIKLSYYSDSISLEFKELKCYLNLHSNNPIGFVGLTSDTMERFIENMCHDVKCISSFKKDDLLCHYFSKWDIPSLIKLPKEFDTLFQFYRKEVCRHCHLIPKYPSLCLVCGKLICYNENCCEKGECPEYVWHSLECGNGTGLYMGIDSSLILIVQSHRMAFWGSLYLDKYGEEDKNLRRGKPLYLNEERYNLLNHMWLTHSLDQLCKQWTFQGN